MADQKNVVPGEVTLWVGEILPTDESRSLAAKTIKAIIDSREFYLVASPDLLSHSDFRNVPHNCRVLPRGWFNKSAVCRFGTETPLSVIDEIARDGRLENGDMIIVFRSKPDGNQWTEFSNVLRRGGIEGMEHVGIGCDGMEIWWMQPDRERLARVLQG